VGGKSLGYAFKPTTSSLAVGVNKLRWEKR